MYEEPITSKEFHFKHFIFCVYVLKENNDDGIVKTQHQQRIDCLAERRRRKKKVKQQ